MIQTSMLLFLSISLGAQSSYSGVAGNQKMEFIMDLYSDGTAIAAYSSGSMDPVLLHGKTKKKKAFFFIEGKDRGKMPVIFSFKKFDANSTAIAGKWLDVATNHRYTVQLSKDFDFGNIDDQQWSNKEIIQPVSLKEKYFKLRLSKDPGEYASVTGVKVLDKKSNELLQEINLDCQLLSINNLSVGDFNFDGYEDFSVFEQSYSGPNTSSLYFLFDPDTGLYGDSGYSGISLEFDLDRKRIYEHDQCCAGLRHTNAEYQVVDNRMVLLKKTCFEYDEAISDYKEVDCH